MNLMPSQVFPISFISFSTVRRHVILGRPRLRFPSGVQCIAVFAMEASWRATWPIHLQRLLIAEDCHLDVVGVLARSNEPESYAGWTSRGPGRDTHARQVKG